MRAKSFFYVCLGVLALALAYHLGASTASAQAPGNPVVAAWSVTTPSCGFSSIVVTANGDVYQGPCLGAGSWGLVANVFSGSATPARKESMGQLKARYRRRAVW